MLPLVAIMTWRLPLHWMLLLQLQFVALPGQWEVAGVKFGPSDLLLAGIAVALYRARRKGGAELRHRIPYFKIWLLLGIVLSISYLVVPVNRGNLTDPVRIVYQLYRYCWKPIIYYPLAIILLGDVKRLKTALFMVVVAGDLCALLALPDGFAGDRASGPFKSGNALGAALTIPILTCLAALLYLRSNVHLAFFALSLALLGRAYLYSGSRGAFAGLIVACVCLVGWTYSSRSFRPRMRRLAVVAAVALVGLLVVKPDLFQRPNVRRMLSASQGSEVSTLRWRLEDRWPHFWNKSLEHPWVGTGDYVDQTLGPRANTPHNGYLALAVKSGWPAVALYLLLSGLAIRQGLRAVRRRRDPLPQIVGALAIGGMLGILTHNVVDNIFMVTFTRDVFWMLAGFAVIAARLQTEVVPARSSRTSASWRWPRPSRSPAGN
jgi:hypothetical protein